MTLRPAAIAWTLCAIGFIAIFLAMATITPPQESASAPATAGTALGGPFTLTDQNGTQVTERSWPGQYLLLYFGFTHCPDVCPTGLNKIAEALRQLSDSEVAKIQPILITVDPARDTAEDLKTYVAIFHPKLIGLTGTESQIEHTEKLFKVYAQKQGDGPDYMVNHSAFTYLLAPDGQLAGLFSHDVKTNDMAKQISQALKK